MKKKNKAVNEKELQELQEEELEELDDLDEEDEDDIVDAYYGGGNGCLVFLAIILALFLAVGVGVLKVYNYVRDYNEAYMPEVTQTYSFTIKAGQSTTQIANNLLYSDFLKPGTFTKYIFILKTKFLGYDGKYQAGNFSLSPSMTMEEIMETLQDADMQTKRFTIAEGLNLKQIGQKLEEQEVCKASEFYAALDDAYGYSFVPEGQYADPTGTISAHGNRLEGFLFPDTYEVFLTATPHDIIDKMLARFEKVYTAELSARAAELDLSLKDVITIASLVERECRVDDERPTVASVVYNRIKSDMKLEFCSTVQYALGEVKSRLLNEDLKVESPYNTYQNAGLPPAPIASPGLASIQAALYPQETDYLYFVVKNDGSNTHNFAANYKDFENYKEDYLKTLD